MQDLAFWVQDLAFVGMMQPAWATERQAVVSWGPGLPALALL